MEDNQEVQQNMVSNLPLLFANGYPTSLEKITNEQLEDFIPFMVQCSLGHINLQGRVDYSEPEWWPEDVPFSIPVIKPKKFQGNWLDKLKEIVKICYQFHKSAFLLRFCHDLASFEPATLRFMNNCNSTTSLYNRRSNKLLVTFRNENMLYDQPQRNRKCLFLQKSRSKDSEQEQMVEPALFDIYLCDNCDAELYSLEAMREHEKTCTSDDDVIICDSPQPSSPKIDECKNTNEELKESFLANFNLQTTEVKSLSTLTAKGILKRASPTKEDIDGVAGKKLKRLPRRNRAMYALTRCQTIPLSSPAGQLMMRNTKTVMANDYLEERLERLERFCHAPILHFNLFQRPKFLDKKLVPPYVHCTFKKPPHYNYRMYTFFRRQFTNIHRVNAYMFLNSLLFKKCRPISVRIKRLKDSDIKSIQNSLRCSTKKLDNAKDKEKSSNSQPCLDTIDLCSSDEEDISITGKSSIISPEVTLTPISKDLEHNSSNIRKQSKFAGNFLLSPTATAQPKPLQPSVFLFSNYTTENLNLYRYPYSNNNSPQISDIHFQNQENLENNIKNAGDDWTGPQNVKSDRNTKVYQLMSCVDNEVAINKISSPNRTVLIDLTS